MAKINEINAYEVFSEFHKQGKKELVNLKTILNQEKKNYRTWGIKQASIMIGRSAPWVRNYYKKKGVSTKNKKWTLEEIDEIKKEIGTNFKRPKKSSPFVISVINFKGGVSKTTVTMHLAQKAAMEGMKVLVIDLDPQASCSYILGNLIPEVDLTEDDILNPVLLEPGTDISNIIRKTNFYGVDIVPTNLGLQHMDLVLPNDNLNNKAEMGSAGLRIAKALASVKKNYDLILFDCPPNMGTITFNALIASNGILIPVPPASFDRASFVTFTASLEFLYKQINKRLDYLKILITQHGGKRSDNFHEGRIRKLYSHVASNNFYRSVEVEKAATEMKTIYDLERPLNDRETHLRAVTTVDNLMNEILEDLKEIWKGEENEQ